jgi:ABC-type uncharacterized transport system ATPase subunit
MSGITKSFGDKVIANRSVNFSALEGEIHALVGENGAGKSTLMKILYGMHSPDKGKIKIRGNEVKIDSPAKAIKLGIGMVHQHFMLVNPLTVAENIILGDEPAKKLCLIDKNKTKKLIEKLIQSFKLDIDLNAKIENLSVGQRQKVEILKILYRNSDILILDEPTAVLTPQEADELFSSLKDLKKQGKTIILITHKLDEVISVSERVTVLRKGEVTGVLKTEAATKEEIAKLMIGDESIHEEKKVNTIEKDIILNIERLSVLNNEGVEKVKNISIYISAGEILGIAGVEGNGQTELVEAITSLRKISRGNITYKGKGFTYAHIPADSHKNGIVMDFSISSNVLLGRQNEKRFTNGLLIKENSVEKYTSELIEKYDIRPANADQKIKELSGGNQQKVVAARELSKETDLVIASNPTRGLDIKGTNFVRNRIIEAKNEGKAVLVVSSDLNELLNLSDRIAVMYKGEIAAIFDSDKTNEREIGMYMTGAKGKKVD